MLRKTLPGSLSSSGKKLMQMTSTISGRRSELGLNEKYVVKNPHLGKTNAIRLS